MKKVFSIIMMFLMMFGATACAATARPSESTEQTATAVISNTAAPALSQKQDVVVFKDQVLEKMVRGQMGKPEGGITLEEARAVTELNMDIEWRQDGYPEGTQITDLGGLENFTNLKGLSVQFHAIKDISPLAGLTNLKGLAIGGNQISDISPLSNLTQLDFLCIFNCQAADYSPLARLTNLRVLYIDWSSFSDLSVLAGMEGLEELTIANTQVSDLAPIAGLTNLKTLKLENSLVTDYSPVKDIYPNLKDKDFTLE